MAAKSLKDKEKFSFESFSHEKIGENPPFNILVVDENELIQKVVEIRLKNRGAQAFPLLKAKDVTKVISEKKFDLVIVNLNMPEVSGKEILKEIRSRFSPIELPVIMIAERASEDELIECLKIGANDFFTKPVNFTLSWARIQTQATIKRFFETIEKGRRELIKSASMKILLEMVRNVAHEINNPLTVVMGKVEKIKANLDSKENTLTELKNIEEAITRAENVIEGLQVFSQDESEKKFGPIKFDGLLERVKVICQGVLLSEGIDFRIVEQDKNLTIKGKEGQLIQVMFNLVMNSRKAISKTEKPFIEISSEKKGNNKIQIAITDSGKGITTAISDKIFDPFFTTQDSNTALGMGLTLCKDIVEKNGGEIYLNKESKNTQFIITLPLWE